MILKYIYITLGSFFLLIGVIGIFLPLLPTTPFLIIAAFFFSKGSDKFYHWLMYHKYLGPPIQDWNQHGLIRKPHKIIATSMMSVSALFVLTKSTIPIVGKVSFSIVLCTVLIFIWTRPSTPKKYSRESKSR